MNSTQLSHFEQQVMNIVWSKQKCSIREVVVELQKDRGIAYTTVATIMQRLYEKKLLTRKEEGKGYVYHAKFTKKSYLKKITQNFLEMFFSSYGDTAIVSFAESIDDLPKEKREYLLSLLDQHDESK